MFNTCIIVAGPTATGKTAAAIQLAQHFQTEIISADSRQCYRELNVGVAKPGPSELAVIPHHFINSHSIHDNVTAADFEVYALSKANELFTRYSTVVMVGGTGLYIKAFCEGMDEIPAIDADLRKMLTESYETKGISWLQSEMLLKDPQFMTEGEWQNPRRLLRALEVVMSTGKSILSFQSGNKKTRPFRIIKLAIDWPREILYERINKRVEQMITDGLEVEAKALFAFKNLHLNALQTVGYQEWFDFFEGKPSHQQAIDKIKQNTRHYAKRQLTWFKRDTEMRWVGMEEFGNTRFLDGLL